MVCGLKSNMLLSKRCTSSVLSPITFGWRIWNHWSGVTVISFCTENQHTTDIPSNANSMLIMSLCSPVLFLKDCFIIWHLATRNWFGAPSGPGWERFAPALRPLSWWSLWRYAIPFPNFSWLTPTAITLRNSSPKDKTLIEWMFSAPLMDKNSALSSNIVNIKN